MRKEVHGLKKTKDTEYLYLSANIRAQETRMIGTQALHKMISAATAEEAYKTVTDAGIGVDYDYRDFESALTQELSATYERLEKAYLRTRKCSKFSVTNTTAII